MNSTKMKSRLEKIVAAWSDLRPTKSFAGMTLEQFKTAIQPSLDARATIAAADNTRTAAAVQRDDADEAALAVIQRVVGGVIADGDESNDGELYKAMGFVRKSERASGLTRASRNGATQPNAAVTKTA